MSTRQPFDLDPARIYERGDPGRMAAARARESERWRRARLAGIVGTVAIHLLFLVLFRRTTLPPAAPSSAPGPAAGDIRAAGGGGSGLTMIEIRPQRALPQEEVPVPVPVPTPVPEELVIEPEEVEVVAPDPAPVADPLPSLPGTALPGPGAQGGQGTGTGSATGAGDGAGGGGDQRAPEIVPPRPRGIFIPPSGRPSSARGQEITVWVFVRETGRVDEGTIRLEPPTGDSRYDRRLIQSVAEWVFDPATQAGRAVPVWYPFQIIL